MSMLFMQQAVAAYVCPNAFGEQIQSPQLPASADTSMTDMSGCAGQDLVAPTLCYAFDVSESQSLDKPSSPAVQPFQPSSLHLIVEPASTKLGLWQCREHGAMAATSMGALPLSIRNCRFLI